MLIQSHSSSTLCTPESLDGEIALKSVCPFILSNFILFVRSSDPVRITGSGFTEELTKLPSAVLVSTSGLHLTLLGSVVFMMTLGHIRPRNASPSVVITGGKHSDSLLVGLDRTHGSGTWPSRPPANGRTPSCNAGSISAPTGRRVRTRPAGPSVTGETDIQ